MRNLSHGWIILDKPIGMSSARAVSRVKRLLDVKKAGHAGTLDPLASGVLPIACGEATKTMQYVVSEEKEYAFTVQFKEQRDTDDAEGDMVAVSDVMPSEQALLEVLPEFSGVISQIPPVYSAIKQQGKRSYALAREGKVVEMAAREVVVHELEMVEYDAEQCQASFRVLCGKGTYVRSLGRDIAQKCGSLGYISALRRTKVGRFDQKMIISLERLETIVHNAELCMHMLPVVAVLDDIPAVAISSEQARNLRYGQIVQLLHMHPNDVSVRAMQGDDLIALALTLDASIKPVKVFNL